MVQALAPRRINGHRCHQHTRSYGTGFSPRYIYVPHSAIPRSLELWSEEESVKGFFPEGICQRILSMTMTYADCCLARHEDVSSALDWMFVDSEDVKLDG